MTNTVDQCRSYATREALLKALDRYGLAEFTHRLEVRNSEGRWTAIFSPGQFKGNLTLAPYRGFMVFG